mmetsp:Transcript_22774/g.54519  ORF Transcript_22774/g.54519 Transcript_22774/m.54519 type:complete len:222 (+) Transcript_22774:1063-1728(+)
MALRRSRLNSSGRASPDGVSASPSGTPSCIRSRAYSAGVAAAEPSGTASAGSTARWPMPGSRGSGDQPQSPGGGPGPRLTHTAWLSLVLRRSTLDLSLYIFRALRIRGRLSLSTSRKRLPSSPGTLWRNKSCKNLPWALNIQLYRIRCPELPASCWTSFEISPCKKVEMSSPLTFITDLKSRRQLRRLPLEGAKENACRCKKHALIPLYVEKQNLDVKPML